AFCPQFSFQLCSPATPLVPALQEVGLVWINETGPLLAGTRVRDSFRRDPPLNGSRCDAELERNLSAVYALFLQRHNVLIPSRSIGLTSPLRVLDGSCLGRTPLFYHLPLCFFF